MVMHTALVETGEDVYGCFTCGIYELCMFVRGG